MSTLRTTLACAALAAGSWTAPLLAQATVVPTDIQQPGTQPDEASSLQPVSKCDNCHGGYDALVEPDFNWRGSMMAQATRDPIFWATVAVAEQDFAGAGDLCLRCHTPDGWIDGRSTPTDGSTLQDNHAEGVSCDACHRMTNPDQSEWLGVQNAPFLAHDGGSPPTGFYGGGMYVLWPNTNEKFGPYADAVPNHGFFPSQFHRSAAFCGTCHDVSNPAVGDLSPTHGAQVPLEPGTFNGALGGEVGTKAAFNNFPYQYGIVERTFSEHQASAYSTLEVGDYPSLPAELQDGSIETAYLAAMASSPDGNYVDGAVRTYTCQTCHMPPVTGKGCNKAAAPVRTDLPLHDMSGGNTWMPEVIAYMDGFGELVVGGGLTSDQLDALDAGAARALGNLTSAASLSVDGDTVRVVNLTGHKLLSGYPEGRRMWLNVRWYDGQTLLREDGEYDTLVVDIDGVPTPVETILDLDGTNTRIWEAHHGLTQEWAAKLVSLGYPTDLVLSYDRVTGLGTMTLGELATSPPGTVHESFHFVLNDVMVADNRIPPYGLRYDDAQARNILPVPATQYGAPGPGGVFEHFDTVDLSPPPGATSAEIDLLYQSTSWESVQFLELANAGTVAFLAEQGEDLREAWQATGMAAPVVMASTTWTAAPDPWVDLGNALAGTYGEPLLVGSGPLLPETQVTLTLTGALENATAYLVMGIVVIDAPFKGGVLVPDPSPPGFFLVLATDGAGSLTAADTWPSDLPGGFSIYVQDWIVDPAGPAGFAASNAIAGLVP